MTPDSLINLMALPPVMSKEQFSVFVGKPLSTVTGWVATGVVPTIKMGGSRLINFELLSADLKSGKSTFTKGDYDD